MGALTGTMVLEYASFIAGPYCGRLLADLGAEVIKVEPPAGDPARAYGPFPRNVPHPERSAVFVHLNTNKFGVTLDLESAEGQALFRELATAADVVIEDCPPGHLPALGLGYADLARLNPALVMTSITPFGQTGPYRDYRAHPINLFNATEGGSVPKRKGGRPITAGGFIGEYDSGLSAGVATLAALFSRQAAGVGQHVDVSKFEALAALQRVDISSSRNRDESPDHRAPARLGGLLPCKDGHVVITVVEDHQWRSLVQMMGDPEWAADQRYADREQRGKLVGEIQRRLIQWTRQHTKDEIYHVGQAAGCPVGPVQDIAELLDSPQLAARDFFATVDHPEAGRHRQPKMAFQLSESPWRGARAAPLLGQHNEGILRTPLARRPEEIAGLREARIRSGSNLTTTPGSPKALEGIRVVDFTWAWAGPYGTFQLGLLGAEVLKVESAQRLDHTRSTSLTTGQRFTGHDSSTIFNDLNLNKRSVRLNLTRPEAVEIARRLVAVSDVAVQNMRPGVMDRLGLGYEDLRKVKPDIIMLSSSALGSTGPERTYVGYAPVFSAIGGLASVTGVAGGAPVPLYGSVDLRSATMSAFAILGALNHRARTGEGQHIDLSSAESVTCLIGHLFAEYQLTGRLPRRRGNDDAHMAPHNSYRCRGNEWVTIAVGSDAEWMAFRRTLGEPGWTREDRFAAGTGRRKNRRALDRLVEAWTQEHSAEEATQLLQAAGVAALPCLGPAGLAHDRQLEARGFIEPVVHPVLGRRDLVVAPWKLSATPARIERPAPLLGEHNEYVLHQVLGIPRDEIASLEERRIVY